MVIDPATGSKRVGDAVTRTAPGLPAVPKLTVLVAALDEADNIAAFICSFLELEYPNKELVLCAGGDDGTYELALALSGGPVKVLPQRRGEGKQVALRKAVRWVTGDIVVLTDADNLLSTAGVAALIAPILAGREKVTTGISRPKTDQLSNPFVLYQYALESVGLARIRGTSYQSSLLGRNCALLRSVLEEVGDFQEDVPTGTDSFLAKKIVQRGYRIRFVPESVVETDYETSLWDYCRQRSRWTRNGIVNSLRFRLYGRMARGLVPSMIGLAMFGLPFLSIWLGGTILYVWGVLIAFVYIRHVRFVAGLNDSQQRPLSIAMLGRVAVYMWVEWGAHLLALLQLPAARLRRSW